MKLHLEHRAGHGTAFKDMLRIELGVPPGIEDQSDEGNRCHENERPTPCLEGATFPLAVTFYVDLAQLIAQGPFGRSSIVNWS